MKETEPQQKPQISPETWAIFAVYYVEAMLFFTELTMIFLFALVILVEDLEPSRSGIAQGVQPILHELVNVLPSSFFQLSEKELFGQIFIHTLATTGCILLLSVTAVHEQQLHQLISKLSAKKSS